MTRHIGRRQCGQSGMTLIEVLVAVLIFSLGLVALIGLQARAIQYSTSAEDTSRASLLANEIATTMITSQTIALPTSAITAWQARASDPIHGGLPNGAAAVAASGNVATITLTWRAPTAAIGAPNSENRYVTQVVIPM